MLNGSIHKSFYKNIFFFFNIKYAHICIYLNYINFEIKLIFLVKINGNKVTQCYMGLSTFLKPNSLNPSIGMCNMTLKNDNACMVSFEMKFFFLNS